MSGILEAFSALGWQQLAAADPMLYDLLEKEHARQMDTLAMVASASIAEPAALVCESTIGINVTAEGYPSKRFHAGCKYVDTIEQLAIERAKFAFGASYANVQVHSATTANQAVMFSLLEPGDAILALELQYGGHLSHGSRASISGKCFRTFNYGLDESGRIDYGAVRHMALEHRPRLIVCGATAYPRTIDFGSFREIADEVNAYLLADITHIAGLVAAGLHPSPINYAHFVTTCTHKQLYGPRGGLILMGRDCDLPGPRGEKSLVDVIQRGVFPLLQGAPVPNSLAAKASAFGRLTSPEFRALAERIVACSRNLARELMAFGYTVVGGGSDNHIVLIDLGRGEISGLVAQKALEECNIVVNKNPVPGDYRKPWVASGIRLGTNALAARHMGPTEMVLCAELIDRVLRVIQPSGDHDYQLDPTVRTEVQMTVKRLCQSFPLTCYQPEHRSQSI